LKNHIDTLFRRHQHIFFGVGVVGFLEGFEHAYDFLHCF
jgi:hypothetical protein